MENSVKSASLLVDTRATTYQFSSSLDNLENYMGTVNSNAKEGLTARGESISGLLRRLFKGYRATADTKFVEYIEKKEAVYLDGKDFDAEELMQLALNKCTLRMENGEWGDPSIEQEQLTALSAELAKLKSALDSQTGLEDKIGVIERKRKLKGKGRLGVRRAMTIGPGKGYHL